MPAYTYAYMVIALRSIGQLTGSDFGKYVVNPSYPGLLLAVYRNRALMLWALYKLLITELIG